MLDWKQKKILKMCTISVVFYFIREHYYAIDRLYAKVIWVIIRVDLVLDLKSFIN